ncbi:MAG: EI24 domain-containing protein [Myxococcales bacterium]
MPATIPDLTRSSPLDLFRGFGIALRGLGLIFSTPALSRLALGVAFVTVVTLVGLFAGLWHAVPALMAWAWTPPDTWWGATLFTVAEVLAFLLALVAGANTLPMMLAAPLMDPISVATERQLGVEVHAEEGVGRMVTEVFRALANGLVRLAVLAFGQLLLLLVLLVPGVGGPLWSVLSWVWTALWVSAAHLDVPMARHLYSFEQELSVLRRPLLCIGFGAAVALMLYVPILNCFFVPAAVISSTLLFRGLVAAGLLPAPKERGAPG